ncbi:MAG TPA: hypothetical protein PK548_01075 [Bacteroidales bacterium]|jgi:hypothetical protein|nr:hypothetical protein [Bacteroidales bacterium]HQA86435.1 hypothetical protein [Bacteroidales bacterium]
MRKIVTLFFIVLFSITYFTFSSGIFFTIHHCTHICKAYVTQNNCPCEHHSPCEVEHAHSCETGANNEGGGFTENPINFQTNNCHTTYFFKIIDFYDIAEKLILPPWLFLQTDVHKIVILNLVEPLFPVLHYENIALPSFYHLQGNNLIDCLHQRIFYS